MKKTKASTQQPRSSFGGHVDNLPPAGLAPKTDDEKVEETAEDTAVASVDANGNDASTVSPSRETQLSVAVRSPLRSSDKKGKKPLSEEEEFNNFRQAEGQIDDPKKLLKFTTMMVKDSLFKTKKFLTNNRTEEGRQDEELLKAWFRQCFNVKERMVTPKLFRDVKKEIAKTLRTKRGTTVEALGLAVVGERTTGLLFLSFFVLFLCLSRTVFYFIFILQDCL